MRYTNTSQLLSQLLVHQYRSLPMFLTEAVPWTHRGDEDATRVLLDIVQGQRDLSNRVATEMQQRGCPIDTGEYPMEFLDLHFHQPLVELRPGFHSRLSRKRTRDS